MKNKGCLLMRPLMLRWNRAKIFSLKNGQIMVVFGVWGSGVKKVSIFTAKGTSIRGSTSFAILCVKIGWGVTSRSVREKIKKVTNIVYFTYLPRSPRCSDRHQICSGADFQDVINCAKFHSNPFRGFDFVGGRILAFPIGMRCRR